LNNLRFNRAVAAIYTLTNAIIRAVGHSQVLPVNNADKSVVREALETLVLLIGPMMPHLAESCWQALGHDALVVDESWPKADPDLIRSDSITIAVQVNGKVRGTMEIARGMEKPLVEAAALSLEPVSRALEGKAPKRVIIVPDRIVNIVA
jgi:leucyl-tRNA synthetase